MALPEDFRTRMTLPAVSAPMFLISGVDLAIESCKAGIIGCLNRNHCRSHEEFEQQAVAASNSLAQFAESHPGRKIGPLAANISVGMPSRERSLALDTCRRHSMDVVITAGGDPTDVAAEVHDSGGRIFHDVTTIRFAEKAITAGVDGVIAIGAGGGGHSGTMSHLALVPQIRAIFDGVIVMAGAITTGAAIRAAEILGADLAYLGTRMIATKESTAPQAYKEMIVSQGPADLIYTPAINGIPAMWLKASMRELGLDPDNLPVPAKVRSTGHLPGHIKPWKNLWSAGQGIGLIDDIPSVADLVARLRKDYDEACAIPPFDTRESMETDNE